MEPKAKPLIDETMMMCTVGIMLVLVVQWGGDLLSSAPSANVSTFSVGRFAAMATAIYCALRADKVQPAVLRPAVLFVLAAALTAARALPFFGASFGMQEWGPWACAAISGACECLVFLLWVSLCARLEMRRAAIIVPLAYALAGLVYFCFAALHSAVGAIAVSLCSGASAALLVWAVRRRLFDDAADEDRQDPYASWSFPRYPVALMVVYKLVFYFSLQLTSGPSSYGPLGIVAIGTFALVGTLVRFDTFRASILCKIALPLLVWGLLLEGWIDVGAPVATMVTNAGNIAFTLFMIVSLCEVCYRYRVNPLWLFGIVEAFAQASSVVGFLVGAEFVSVFPAGTPVANAVIAGVIVALVAMSALVFDARIVSDSFGMQPQETADDGALANDNAHVHTVMTYYEDFVWRCSIIARRYGLSHREEEILQLLAQGMSSARIEQELFISKNTVKTHTHHIYEKLGVHSRDEARLMVERVHADS